MALLEVKDLHKSRPTGRLLLWAGFGGNAKEILAFWKVFGYNKLIHFI